MTTWNHRVGFKRHIVDGEVVELEYGIVEVYYNEDGGIRFTTENFITPYGEDMTDLYTEITMMQEAFKHPILDLEAVWKELSEEED